MGKCDQALLDHYGKAGMVRFYELKAQREELECNIRDLEKCHYRNLQSRGIPLYKDETGKMNGAQRLQRQIRPLQRRLDRLEPSDPRGESICDQLKAASDKEWVSIQITVE